MNDRLPEFSIEGRAPPSDSPHEEVSRIKPLSELALTLWILRRCGISVPVLDRLVAWVWRESRNGQRLLHLLLARHDFLPACALYAPLYRMGYRSPALDAVIGMLAASKMAAILPLQPWVRLALAYNLWQLEQAPRPGRRGRGLFITARPEPWVVSGEVAYAITHEVFYLSDFGFRPLRGARLGSYLRTWVPYWSRIFLEQGDADVAGEFAMVLSCVGAPAVGTEEHPLGAVLQRQLEDGSVRGPEGAGSFLFSPGDSAARREFLRSYHTTLVMLMGAAMTLRPRSG